MIQTRNPANGQVLAEYEPLNENQCEAAITLADKRFQDWRKTPWSRRTQCLSELAKRLRHHQPRLALLMTREMGKPIAQSKAEVEKCAAACEFYADKPENWLSDETLLEHKPRALVTFQPLGVVLGIMPWNFPLWQVVRCLIPTTLAGNTLLMKHAQSTWGSAQALAELVLEAGFPEGVYQDFRVGHDQIGHAIEDQRIRAVSLTGSTRAGKQVAQKAGLHLKRCVLELGGSDPYVILHDADVQLAAKKSAEARMINGGQSCIAGKRFIVDARVHDEFLHLVKMHLADYKMGNPEDEKCMLGPMARHDLRDQLKDQVQTALQQGAKSLIAEQKSPNESGAYFPVTLLGDVDQESIVFKDEFFGPVAAVTKAQNEKEALRLANATSFGLGAAIFSRDTDRATELARTELEAGLCVVNGLVRSDARWPFGGVKESGYGRELTQFGAREFVNIKSVVID